MATFLAKKLPLAEPPLFTRYSGSQLPPEYDDPVLHPELYYPASNPDVDPAQAPAQMEAVELPVLGSKLRSSSTRPSTPSEWPELPDFPPSGISGLEYPPGPCGTPLGAPRIEYLTRPFWPLPDPTIEEIQTNPEDLALDERPQNVLTPASPALPPNGSVVDEAQKKRLEDQLRAVRQVPAQLQQYEEYEATQLAQNARLNAQSQLPEQYDTSSSSTSEAERTHNAYLQMERQIQQFKEYEASPEAQNAILYDHLQQPSDIIDGLQASQEMDYSLDDTNMLVWPEPMEFQDPIRFQRCFHCPAYFAEAQDLIDHVRGVHQPF